MSEAKKRAILKNVKIKGELTDLIIEDGKIAHVGKTEESGIDFCGLKLYPGLIDIHGHGCLGHDVSDGDDSLGIMADYHLENGTTTWYPTTGTLSKEAAYRSVRRDLNIGHGANMPGYHLEGPFLNPLKKGAHDENLITAPKLDWIKECPLIKRVTVAPELPGAKKFIEECGIQVTIGHTDADYQTAMGAMRAGATSLTHTFNAMNGIHHRAPGPIGACMDSEGVYAELICDGYHVHPSVVRMLVRIMGYDRVILVSDTIVSTGLPDGVYDSIGLTVYVKDGKTSLADGTIAGSTTMLLGCVKRAIEFGIPEDEAVKMATENPARLMGLSKGKIEVGYDADFILVDDDFNLKKVIVRGEV